MNLKAVAPFQPSGSSIFSAVHRFSRPECQGINDFSPICTACGTQYPASAQAPVHCVICEEERQYVPTRGQTWTTLQALRQTHTNTFREYEKGIIGIGSTPAFAIGQRALLVRTDDGNILWDCIATLDDATVTMIEGLGGIDAIAISHPHFYTTMVEWAVRSRRQFTCTLRTSNGSCGAIRLSSYGTARRKHFGTASRWCDAAVISKAAPCCTGPAGQADMASFAPATSSP